MVTTLPSAVVVGMQGYTIDVEVDIARGFPGFSVVGLPDTVVKESKERIRTAIKNARLDFPEKRVTVNFVPANLKKEGSHLDLAMALGVLRVGDDAGGHTHIGVLGELNLSGQVIGIKNILPLLLALYEAGIDRVMIPKDNLEEAKLLKHMQVCPVASLQEAYALYQKIDCVPFEACEGAYTCVHDTDLDFSQVGGQDQAKRAMEIAASGGHHILMLGPPGSGKTMLARRLPSIMPHLTYEEIVELTKLYGMSHLNLKKPIVTQRPFRAPHHTVSAVSLCGGGTVPKPGEVSLSHRGVLFLDEFPEYKRSAIESLRQPLEDHEIQVTRSTGSVTFPCYFTLIAAFNPCPCGYLNDAERECKCSPFAVKKYLSKISGPIVDRFDMQVMLDKVPYTHLRNQAKEESSSDIKARVERVRQVQRDRFSSPHKLNAHMSPDDIKTFCALSDQSERFLEKAYIGLKLSARSLGNVLKLARTLADMADLENISQVQIAEALQYRRIDKEVLSDV